ncbi:RAMP superfamily CRISPR-associated protein [Candidatus Accumulibacter sp. ACC003]|uniref:RAMP superfamily CRISPR-associated protein n=1 Tax=Candidatus Accumulibacter sp. ACC003 TaxID=2823334 RepID=UPI00344C162B
MTRMTLSYDLSFATPAFVGDAAQQAQWRTPPFKALIRQWWRVVKAPQVGFQVNGPDGLRAAEHRLFGSASDNFGESSHQSLVRLRLKDWAVGQLANSAWPRQEINKIPVGKPGQGIRADLYLGFGPITPESRGKGLPERVRLALDPQKQRNELSISFGGTITESQINEVRQAISLASWFGGIGSRSRNGWGSITLQGDGIPRLPRGREDVVAYCQPFQTCFMSDRDWPHALGSDDLGPLAWIGRKDGAPFRNWREAVFFLATLRRAIRAAAKSFGRNQDISANQLIAYPVTKSDNRAWGNDERIAGSLRLKVIETGQGLVPVAVHLPCAVPRVLFEKLSPNDQRWIEAKQVDIWAAVHQDIGTKMNRLGSMK